MDKKCPYCGTHMPEEASFCLECFSSLNITPLEVKEERNKFPKVFIVVIILALILSIAVSIILVKSVDNKDANVSTSNIKTTAKTTENTVTTEQTTQPTTQAATKETTIETTTESTSTTTETTTKVETTSASSTKSTTTKKPSTMEKTTTKPKEIIFDGDTLTDYPSSRKNTSYTIPYKVTKISKNAFNNNKYLKSLKFSKREKLDCDFKNLFANLPNLETVYVYPGTDADLEGLQYFDGEIIYYD